MELGSQPRLACYSTPPLLPGWARRCARRMGFVPQHLHGSHSCSHEEVEFTETELERGSLARRAVLCGAGTQWRSVASGFPRETCQEYNQRRRPAPPPPSGLDMGYTLPPAFCPQTHLGLNSFGIYSTHGILGVDRDPRIDCWTKEEVGGAEGPDVWARGSLSGCQQLAGSTAEHPQEFPPRMQAVSGEHH